MTVNYYINGKDFYTQFGVKVSASKGLVDAPKKKDPVNGSWPDQHGIVVDLTKQVYDAREIILECWCTGTSIADFQSKLSLFFAEFDNSGLLPLTLDIIPGKPLVYMVYLMDSLAISKVWRDGVMVGTFTLKLIEPEPVKKILTATVSAGGTAMLTITCTEPLNIYWGDGNVSRDVVGTSQVKSNVYSAAGTYYIVITGRIEDITSLTPTGATVTWANLP